MSKLTLASWKNKGNMGDISILFPENGMRPFELVKNMQDFVKHNANTAIDIKIGTFSQLAAIAAETACKELNNEVCFEIDNDEASRKEFYDYLTQDMNKLKKLLK